MWNYEKRLQYPVKINQTNPKAAMFIISQYGGPDGELSASMRYLAQRYTMLYNEVQGLLTDIGTEELAHMEMICAIVYQLTKNLTPEKARTTYDNILRLIKDPEIADPIRFLREREIVHFQRFGEANRMAFFTRVCYNRRKTQERRH